MNPFWTAVLAVATAIGSLGGLGGIVVVIFKAGEARRELRETHTMASETRAIVDNINKNGCDAHARGLALKKECLTDSQVGEVGV